MSHTPGVHTTVSHTAESEEKITIHIQITANQHPILPAPHVTSATCTTPPCTSLTSPEFEALAETFLSTA